MKRGATATYFEIHEFAVRWLEEYRCPDTLEWEAEKAFADECRSLGFEMDGGQSFHEAFPETNAFDDAEALNEIINQIEDSYLLGSAIFSKWRHITHWAEESLLAPEHKDWFVAALSRLENITAENSSGLIKFQGRAKKIRIESNNIGYGPEPKPDDEVEQHLTISDDGRVQFAGFNYGQADSRYNRYECCRSTNLDIGPEAASRILDAAGLYFSNRYDGCFATDIGIWEMTITNTEGKLYRFYGSLCVDIDIGGTDLSDLIRETLDMPELILFNGSSSLDRVEKITVDYHRVTKYKPKVTISDDVEYNTWDYNELLVVDRATETIEYIQNVGSGCVISRKYYVQEGIAELLNSFEAESLFESVIGNDPDVITDPNETRDYKITVDFRRRPQLVISGTYDKNSLPEDWPEVAESIFDFIRFYSFGEIVNSNIYMKAKRKAGDYIFCSVEFEEDGKSYYYITEDDSLTVGDLVVVPVGKDGGEAIVEIVKIEYYPEEKVPFPLDKVKSIIRKCTNEDFETETDHDENDNTALNNDSSANFNSFILCDEKAPRAEVAVWAELTDGCLKISGQDLGEDPKVFFGEDEYEYCYVFDPENTQRLFALIAPEKHDIKTRLLQEFGGLNGCNKLRTFCDQNNIEYKFFSH